MQPTALKHRNKHQKHKEKHLHAEQKINIPNNKLKLINKLQEIL